MKLIGLTGGIASGKSTAAKQLEALGALVVDADQIARDVVMPQSTALNHIVQAFGNGILGEKGDLDRQALGRLVFSDPQARRRLEGLLHPMIQAVMMERIEQFRQTGASAVVLMVPLLFEKGMETLMDEIWVVVLDPETQMRRLMGRDSLTREEAADRIAAQMPLKEKALKADVVIDNNGSLDDICQSVSRAWRERG
jgi:dephospho-CoA kinase